MSHIFDALQRAEAERSGMEFPAGSIATELLQVVERQAVEGCETHTGAEIALEKPAALLRILPVTKKDEGVEGFSQFQSVQVVPSAESKLVCLTQRDSLAAEKFRFLAVRLRHIQHNKALKKLLVTSTIPQEGKSTVAANLACTLAHRNQQKTLLVEGDLRRPSLAHLFGLEKLPGICEWLQGGRDLETAIYHLQGAGLWILPAGSSPSNPLELMQSGRLSAAMDQLITWFDWIVVDSPPVLPLGDTSIWMRLCDGILLVTRQGTTEKKQLQRGLEALDQSKLIGALINNCSSVAHNDYYYHYGASKSPNRDAPEAKPSNQVNELPSAIKR